MSDSKFVLGVDLDGVVADFYAALRPIAAEWLDVPVGDLTENVTYGLPEWGFGKPPKYDYLDLHRFAVTQRNFFRKLRPVPGAAATLRRLDARGDVRIRIITHRLFIKYTHQLAAGQTIAWLDYHAIPYWDLCFMMEKDKVGASLYIEDGPDNIRRLVDENKKVILFDNSTNRLPELDKIAQRALSWDDVEKLVMAHFETWKAEKENRRASRVTVSGS